MKCTVFYHTIRWVLISIHICTIQTPVKIRSSSIFPHLESFFSPLCSQSLFPPPEANTLLLYARVMVIHVFVYISKSFLFHWWVVFQWSYIVWIFILSILLLMDTWALFSFWLLWINQLSTFLKNLSLNICFQSLV